MNASGALGAFSLVDGINLTAQRNDFVVLVAGHWLYAVAGWGQSSGYIAPVERATIGPDGSLGPFALVSGVTLKTPRWGPSAVVAGNSLYVIGGQNMTAVPESTVERATIGVDGSLSDFATVPNVALSMARWKQTSVVIGNAVYVTGGFASAPNNLLGNVERAPINADGSLGPFAILSAVSLNVARNAHVNAVLGRSLWVLTGLNYSPQATDAENAAFAADDLLLEYANESLRAPAMAGGDDSWSSCWSRVFVRRRPVGTDGERYPQLSAAPQPQARMQAAWAAAQVRGCSPDSRQACRSSSDCARQAWVSTAAVLIAGEARAAVVRALNLATATVGDGASRSTAP